MMAVIVDHGDAVPFAGLGETALHATEAGDRLADRIVRDTEFARHGDRGCRVGSVVTPRHRQHEIFDLMHSSGLAIAERDLEPRSAAHRGQINQPRIGLWILAVSDDATILDLADEALHHGMIDTHYGKAVERQVLDEKPERVLHGVERLEVI